MERNVTLQILDEAIERAFQCGDTQLEAILCAQYLNIAGIGLYEQIEAPNTRKVCTCGAMYFTNTWYCSKTCELMHEHDAHWLINHEGTFNAPKGGE